MAVAFFSVVDSFSSFHRRPFIERLSTSLKSRGHSTIYFHRPVFLLDLFRMNKGKESVDYNGITVRSLYTLLPISWCLGYPLVMLLFVTIPVKVQVAFQFWKKKERRNFIWFYKPDQFLYLGKLYPYAYTHYDNYEDDANYPFSRFAEFQEVLGRCVSGSEVTFTTSMALKKKLGHREKIRYLSNAVDDSFIDIASVEAPKKIIGYVGSIDQSIDVRLIEAVCLAFPDWEIRMIGSVRNQEINDLAFSYSNLLLVGKVRYEELGTELKSFSVGICPYAPSKFNMYRNPLKLIEYFSFGVAAVATDCDFDPEGRVFSYISKDGEDFVNKIKQAIKEDSDTLRAARRVYARKNTWSIRAEYALDELGL